MLGRFRHFRVGAILGPLMPFFATLLALLVGAVMLLALGANPLEAYGALADGAFGSPNALADTVVKATPPRHPCDRSPSLQPQPAGLWRFRPRADFVVCVEQDHTGAQDSFKIRSGSPSSGC